MGAHVTGSLFSRHEPTCRMVHMVMKRKAMGDVTLSHNKHRDATMMEPMATI